MTQYYTKHYAREMTHFASPVADATYRSWIDNRTALHAPSRDAAHRAYRAGFRYPDDTSLAPPTGTKLYPVWCAGRDARKRVSTGFWQRFVNWCRGIPSEPSAPTLVEPVAEDFRLAARGNGHRSGCECGECRILATIGATMRTQEDV